MEGKKLTTGEIIMITRNRKGFTKEGFSRQLLNQGVKVCAATLGRIESDMENDINLKKLASICQLLDIDLSVKMGGFRVSNLD